MLIETCGLCKVYGVTVAVDHLTLAVGEGEVFGFLGPNGAGKTTTIKMLLGLATPTAGQARILGRLPGDPAVMGQIGFLPEQFRFPPWITAADFLDVHGRLYGLSAAERRRRSAQLLARVGLADRGRSKLGEFSKGMLQRIGLAQALLSRPRLVILDEPTSGLDPLGRREVRDLIHELRADGVTVFLNSHFLSEVEVTCDRIAIIKRGRVVRLGTLAELTRQRAEVEIVAAGMTPEIEAGLTQWGRIVQRLAPAEAATPPDAGHLILAVADEAVAPQVACYLVQAGARLHMLAPRRLSLEELFLRVMEEET